jgi:tetratricopeptide (TPR) repeat protein
MRTTILATVTAAALAATATAADFSKPAAAAGLDTVKRAELLVARQSWPDAVAAYREAIAASPGDAVLRNRLGICYQHLGDARAARAAYRKALELDKGYAAAHNNLGTLEHSRGKYKQAIAAYAKAIQLKPQVAVFHKNLGSAWLARGDVERALEAWSEAMRLDPVAFEDDALRVPATGVSLAWERLLSAAFIRSPDYGTRCSTVIKVGAGSNGQPCASFDEQTWLPGASSSIAGERRRFRLKIA